MNGFYKVIATDNCMELPDVVLNSFDDLGEAEYWRPSDNERAELRAKGYRWLEICPKGWADTSGGFAPFAQAAL